MIRRSLLVATLALKALSVHAEEASWNQIQAEFVRPEALKDSQLPDFVRVEMIRLNERSLAVEVLEQRPGRALQVLKASAKRVSIKDGVSTFRVELVNEENIEGVCDAATSSLLVLEFKFDHVQNVVQSVRMHGEAGDNRELCHLSWSYTEGEYLRN